MRLKWSKTLMARGLIVAVCSLLVAYAFVERIMPMVLAESGETNVFMQPGAAVTASGADAMNTPDKAIDGARDTKWSYNVGMSADNPAWIKVDVGAEATVSRFELKHAGAGGESADFNSKDYSIEISHDDVNWEQVVTVTGNVYDETSYELDTPVTAQYFKLNITNAGGLAPSDGTYAANIYEFQAYGYAGEELQAPQSMSAGNGLFAAYYTGKGEGGNYGKDVLKTTAVDPQINFGDLVPVLSERIGRAENGFVSWTGEIMPAVDGDYTFYLMGDNGFRLWIEEMDQPVIDFWVNEWDKEQTSAAIPLEAGKKYKFKLEFFQATGGSNLYLRWSAPGIEKQIIPAEAFFLPADYNGPINGRVLAENGGNQAILQFSGELDALPQDLESHLSVTAGNEARTVISVSGDPEDASILRLQLNEPIAPGVSPVVQYDGNGNLQTIDGSPIGSFIVGLEPYEVYSPISIAMSFYGSPKTNRSFAWYTNYDSPQHAPANALDSIVEVVPADGEFGTDAVERFVGKPEETQVLNLKITNSTNGTFVSHKVLVAGLTPGTSYKYRVGSDGNWSDTGTFTTEGENEQSYEFLYMTDSQGANTQDYEVWANTLRQGLEDYPDSKFLVMTGDMVDAGALEYQWLDYFSKPQQMLLNLPLMTAVGNHEGPYNDNYYYHFYYPNDSIEDPLPPGSVYSYDYGDAHFMVLNTMDMGWDARQKESFEQQIEWLRREVAETDKKWKIVAFHKAIYSVGGHSADGDILALRKMLYPVFDELGIDVVLQGHDHTYMRSHQMYDNKAVADVELDENGNPVNPDGTMYIVNNSAGTKYYNVRDEVDKFYAAVFEQPNKPIYSGVKMTENSLTIESYRSGEEAPFDTYTIIRNDGRPEPVKQLSAGRTGNGDIALAWNKPGDSGEDDEVRGFRVVEVNGKLGQNWSAYVPAADGKQQYQYIVEGTASDEVYQFAVTAVDKRDNSPASTISAQDNMIAAPTSPVVDDGFNTFGWTNVPGYDDLTDYEYSTDGGASWLAATANPQPIGDGDFAAGMVMVRVKADAAEGNAAGLPLLSDKPFRVNSIHDSFAITGQLTRGDKLQVDISMERLADYNDKAYVVFELLKGNTPILINAVPVQQDKLDISQYMNVNGAEYSVKVFVLNAFDSGHAVPVYLANPVELK